MVGCPKKEYLPLFVPLCINFEDGREGILEIIPVLCPECRSAVVGVYALINGKVEEFNIISVKILNVYSIKHTILPDNLL
ncbi:MAG: hypothetical protein K9W44_10470 [Candidatus Lokiarchaeota archaeon]|nr:hypothetical protein [Candidatus Harpocratesius repetitus]